MMNKLVLSVLSVVVLLVLPVHSLADAPTPVDYFKAGQFMEFTNYFNYLKIYTHDGLKTKFNDGRQFLVKAGATPKVLDSYDAMVKQMVDLPFHKDYGTWTQAQKDAWNASSIDGTAVNAWVGPVDTVPSYFYWLGFESMRLGKVVPAQINDWGSTLATGQATAKSALQEFTVFRDQNPTVTKTVPPDVQAAVAAVAKYNEKALDPMGNGLSKDDFAAIQQQINIILAAASNGKLTQ